MLEEKEDKEYVNDNEIEEILFNMSSSDFLENEVRSQLGDGIFITDKRDHLEFYIEKYKFIKANCTDTDDLMANLKYNKEEFVNDVIDAICTKFEIDYDVENNTTKMAKVLYTFFVINYKDNLSEFMINLIKKNKQIIIKELKSRKRHRDIGVSASKSKFYNNNDAFIINNIDYILFNILPSIELDGDYINYIINYDDNINYNNMNKLISSDSISLSSDSYRAFISPFLDRDNGYSDVISEIIIKLTSGAKQNDISII